MTAIDTHATGAASTGAGLAGLADWVTTTDHKRIGRLFLGVSALCLVVVAAVAALLGYERSDIDVQAVDINSLTQLFALSRFGLLFLVLLPALVGVAIAVVPLQVGSRSLTFPRVAAGGFWLWLLGGVLAVYSLVLNGGPGGGNPRFVDLFSLSTILVITGVLAGALSVAATALTSRAPGMNMRRVPFFTWSALVSSLVLLVALPVVAGDLIVVYLAHKYPSLSELSGNRALSEWVGFGFTQPTTLLFAIPVLGLLADVAATATSTRLRPRGVLLTGIGLAGTAVFAAVVQYPVVIRDGFADLTNGDKLNDLVPFALVHLLPLLGVFVAVALSAGALRSKPTLGAPLVFALFGALLVLLGTAASAANHIADLELIGTVWEEGAMLALVYGGVLAALGAVAHWGPKWWGRSMPTLQTIPLALLGALGAALASISMLVAGVLGQPGAVFPTVEVGKDAVVFFPEVDGPVALLNTLNAVGNALVAVAVLLFIGLAARSFLKGERAGDDPWNGQTLEWATTSPAPADNFAEIYVVKSAEPLLDLKSSRSDA